MAAWAGLSWVCWNMLTAASVVSTPGNPTALSGAECRAIVVLLMHCTAQHVEVS